MASLFYSILLFLSEPPPAEVLRFLPDRNLVGISIGWQDGIQDGERLAIWRKLNQIAICEVIKTGKTVAFCRIVSRKRGFIPREGDVVIVAGNYGKSW